VIDGVRMRVLVLGPADFTPLPHQDFSQDRAVAQKVHMGTYWQQFNRGVYGGKRKKR
jgi:hypothetical protein